MKNKGLILLIAILLIVFSYCELHIQASEIEYYYTNDYKYTIKTDGTVCLESYIGDDKVVFVPMYIDNKQVTEIARYTFSENSKIKEISIPESVKIIGKGAFLQCINLVKADFYGDIEVFGNSVFQDCSELKEVNFYGKLCGLGVKTFYDCMNLEYVNLPEGVEYLGYECFCYCNQLEYLVLKKGLKSVGAYVFQACNKLTVLDVPNDLDRDNTVMLGVNTIDRLSFSVPEDIAFDETLPEKFDSIKYTNVRRENPPINAEKLYRAAFDYVCELGYEMNNIQMRDAVENPLGIRVYCKTSPEEMYYVCVNQDENGEPDIIYTRKIDIFEYERGDVNRDLTIDVADALEILKYSADLIDLSYANMRIGDFDANGEATSRDALTLLKYVARITETL